ncbi:MAG: hypothetical protein D6681_01335 [Calditrichaeota bacterium]|nr:MAG: hypothetical protein D6681_01335 [Calditrichota bacterium]
MSFARRKRIGDHRGYVLLEALFSVALLTVGLMVALEVFRNVVGVYQFRQYYLGPAQQVAEGQLRKLELRVLSGQALLEGRFSGTKGRFEYTVDVSPWPLSATLKQVRVTVNWKHHGKPGAYSLATVLPASGELLGMGTMEADF